MSKDIALKFGRWQHRIFHSVILLLLSIIYYPFALQIVLLRSLNLR